MASGLPAGHDPRVWALYDYWRKIRPGEGILPGRQHLDPVDLVPLLPHLWLIDVARPPLRFRYRLIGTAVVDAMGRDLTGRWLDEAHPRFESSPAAADFVRVACGILEFSYYRGVPHFHIDRSFVAMERLLLPLARDGTVIDMYLGITLYGGA